MPSDAQLKTAKMAAQRIIGCYPTIPASDPQTFTTGLVGLLASYPLDVIEAAGDPATGIPAHVQFLNLASCRAWLQGCTASLYPERPKPLPGLPPIENTPEQDERIVAGFNQLLRKLRG